MSDADTAPQGAVDDAASELSTSQSFLIGLCRLLGGDTPHATAEQEHMFERPITFQHGDGSTSAGHIDLYRRGAFVLDSKKLKLRSYTKGFDARDPARRDARCVGWGGGSGCKVQRRLRRYLALSTYVHC